MTTPSAAGAASDVFAAVAGQDRAVAQLRAAARNPVHAYLLTGPPGVGVREAARGLAASLLCPEGGCGACPHCRRGLDEAHPDLLVVERVGASLSRDQIDEVLRVAARPPGEGARTVIVLVDFHLVAQQYPRLLKTLEEPPPRTVFLVLADDVPPELVTIASRCVRVDFGLVAPDVIEDVLAGEGVDPAAAAQLAAAAGGRIDRARLLARDPGFAARHAAWRAAADRLLDASGHELMLLGDELRAGIDGVLEPLVAQQAAEREALDARLAVTGERASLRRDLDERHKREQRRIRTDELRFGLATLAGAYRDRLATAPPAARRGLVEAVEAVQDAAAALVRNPNEALLLQGLFARITTALSR